MEATFSGRSGGSFTGLLLIVFAALAAIVAAVPLSKDVEDQQIGVMLANIVVDPKYSHAEKEHPGEAQQVRRGCEKNGAYIMWFVIERGKRYLRTCVVNDIINGKIIGKLIIGFQIVDIVAQQALEKTAYFKDALCSLADVMMYANRVGYTRYTGTIPGVGQ